MQPHWQLLQCLANLMFEDYKYEQLAFQLYFTYCLSTQSSMSSERQHMQCVFPLQIVTRFSSYCVLSHNAFFFLS